MGPGLESFQRERESGLHTQRMRSHHDHENENDERRGVEKHEAIDHCENQCWARARHIERERVLQSMPRASAASLLRPVWRAIMIEV